MRVNNLPIINPAVIGTQQWHTTLERTAHTYYSSFSNKEIDKTLLSIHRIDDPDIFRLQVRNIGEYVGSFLTVQSAESIASPDIQLLPYMLRRTASRFLKGEPINKLQAVLNDELISAHVGGTAISCYMAVSEL